MSEIPRLILYGRHACHLCDEMQAQLPHMIEGRGVALELRDVDEREDWRLEYGMRVPVLMDETGQLLAEYHLDTTALQVWLEKYAALTCDDAV